MSTSGNHNLNLFLLLLEKSRSTVQSKFYINVSAWFILCSHSLLWMFSLTNYAKLQQLLQVNNFHSKDSDFWKYEIWLASMLDRWKVEITTLATQTLSNYTEVKQAKVLWLVLFFGSFFNQLNLLMCKHSILAEYWNEMFWHNQFKMFDVFQLVTFNIVKRVLPRLERFTAGKMPVFVVLCCKARQAAAMVHLERMLFRNFSFS